MDNKKLLNRDIDKGWLTPQVPAGVNVLLGNLGYWEVGEAQWRYDKEAYRAQVFRLLECLQPKPEKPLLPKRSMLDEGVFSNLC